MADVMQDGSLSLGPDVSIVVNAHREGLLAHPTFMSLAHACRVAGRQGIMAEIVVVLDRADEATTTYVSSLVDDAVFDDPTELRVVEVDHGDLGLARNEGMRTARAPIAGLLDADNLVCESWLIEGVRAVRSDPDAVVHPAWIVGFGERRVLWPVISTADRRFRPELLQCHNYWDAFSIARRSTYLDRPYAESEPGQGPEDWHWNIETVAAGIRHVTAPGTALFYRVKGAGSLMSQHTGAGHLLAPAAMLVSRDLARSAVDQQRSPVLELPAIDSDMLDVVRAVVTAPPQPYADVTPAAAATFDPAHYRILHRDLRSMDDEEITEHWQHFGQEERRRPLLTTDEVTALERWRPEYYLLLNPDLSGLQDDDLVDHFLQHGRQEGRHGWLHPEEIADLARLRVDEYLLLNPDLHGLTPEGAVAHFVEHGAGRPTLLPPEPPDVPRWLVQQWSVACGFEQTLPFPSEPVLASFAFYGHAPDVNPPASLSVWWDVVARLPHEPGTLGLMVVVERLDEAGLADHVATVATLDPPLPTLVVVTGAADEPEQPHLGRRLPEDAWVLRLSDAPAYGRLDQAARARLVADLVVQTMPRVVHLWGRGDAFDALARHGAALSQQSVVHVTVDGEGLYGTLSHPLLGRHAGYLAPVSAVWADSPATVDRLWETSRLPRSSCTVRPPTELLPEVLTTMPGYGPGDAPGPSRFYASSGTAALLAGRDPVALIVTGYEGYANLGDILQAKNMSRQWRSRGVTPVHLISASAVRSSADLDACRQDVASPHVLVRGWDDAGPPDALGLTRIRTVSPGTLLHIGGGGYLNKHWHRQRMRDVTVALALTAPRALVVSGVQIDEAVIDDLSDLFAGLPPAILGARDERSRALLDKTTAVPAISSFDDATELIVDWVAAEAVPPARDLGPPRVGTRVGLHLNTSDYAADESVLDVVNAALSTLLERDPMARLTVLQSYDDDRAQVADSLESLPKLRGGFVFDRFDVVDLARAARALDLDAGEVPSLGPLLELDLAIVASYHTAVLLGLLGVPVHLLATNEFYADKAAGLGQHGTLEEFLEDPSAHGVSLSVARTVRAAWLRELDDALEQLHVSDLRTPAR